MEAQKVQNATLFGPLSGQEKEPKSSSLWDRLGPSVKILKMERIEEREYQFRVGKTIHSGENTLVIALTGSGKTNMEFLAAAKAISEGKQAVFLSITKPLIGQHYNSALELMAEQNGVALVSGRITDKEKRASIEKDAKLIIATPETILNDVQDKRMSMDNVGIVIIDECQRVRGDYAYTKLARMAKEKGIQIVAFTGSLTSSVEKAKEILDTLGITRVEVINRKDEEVQKYIGYTTVTRIDVEKSERQKAIQKHFDNIINSNFAVFKQHTTLSPNIHPYFVGSTMHDKDYESFHNVPIEKFMAMQKNVSNMMDDMFKRKIKGKDAMKQGFEVMQSYYRMSYMSHPYILLETQGFRPLLEYIVSTKAKDASGEKKLSKTVKSLMNSYDFQQAGKLVVEAIRQGEEHPKVDMLVKVLKNHPSDKVMVFAQYRSTVRMISDRLNKEGIAARPFMSRKSSRGDKLTEEEKKLHDKLIDNLKEGKLRVAVSTSIGEAGMDVPQMSLVIGFEPVPSAIRYTQRKGRTGRNKEDGEMIVLCTRDSRDEIYNSIAVFNEQRMNNISSKLKVGLSELLRKDKNRRRKRANGEMSLDFKARSANQGNMTDAISFLRAFPSGKDATEPSKEKPNGQISLFDHKPVTYPD